MRHGYGVRTSAPFGIASHFRSASNVRGSETSLNQQIGTAEEAGAGMVVQPMPKRNLEETRGGFVLRTKSDEVPHRRRSLVERTGMKNLVQVGGDMTKPARFGLNAGAPSLVEVATNPISRISAHHIAPCKFQLSKI